MGIVALSPGHILVGAIIGEGALQNKGKTSPDRHQECALLDKARRRKPGAVAHVSAIGIGGSQSSN
jgi:hypothetical protein